MHKIASIGAVMVFLVVLVLGAYFFMRGNKPDDLIIQKSKLQDALILAGEKLKKEKENLDTMTEDLKASFPLAVSVQDQMKKSSEIVKQTDFMFINPYGSKPELIVKNPLTSILINNERHDINLLLFEWQKKINLLSVEEINLNQSEKIKQDVQTIESFIENLSKIVKGLTPKNSGLSQAQINAFVSRLPSTEATGEVLISIETAIENYSNNNLETNTETTNNQNSTSPVLFTPIVTPNDVIAQQSAVAETQNQVTILQEQLTQVQAQIQQASSTTPISTTPTTTDTTTNSNSENQTENQNTDNTDNPAESYTREKNQGIIIQPGPPRLIQGTDAY